MLSVSVRRSGKAAAGGLILLLALALPAPAARAGTVTMQACARSQALSPDWSASSVPAFGGSLNELDTCTTGGRFQIAYSRASASSQGQNGQWNTVLPANMSLSFVNIPAQAALINPETQNAGGQGYASGYQVRYLSGSGAIVPTAAGACCGGLDYASPVSQAIGGRYFIVQVSCNIFLCETAGGVAPPNQIVDIGNLTLSATDNSPPAISVPQQAGSGTNLGAAPHFVRGAFGLTFTASNGNASGVCGMSATIDGTTLPTVVSTTPDTTRWVQCPADGTWSQTVNTASYPDGPLSVTMNASDAASPTNVAQAGQSVVVDNQPVTLALAGPSDVPASPANPTASVTATAGAGPSGANIFCSVDGGSDLQYAGESAHVAVSGLGPHRYACYAQNNALDAAGVAARSATQAFNVSIRQPTAEAISFARIADALRCRTVTVRVRVPGRLRTVTRHHKSVQVRGRAHVIRRRERRCHARTVRRRVVVIVRRHGRPARVHKVIRVVVAPHSVLRSRLTVRHGGATTVSGYLGLPSGAPLGGRGVQVLAAPDDGSGRFAPIATVTSSADGAWTARIPPGPSRLLEAVYGGDATDEPAISTPVRLTVPAKIRLLSVTPRVPWGGTVRIAGRLYGGHLPGGGALVRLRYGYGRRARATFGVVQHVTGDGRFTTVFTFGPGLPGVHVRFWFSASLLPHPDYPYAAASSPRRYMIVGGARL